MKPSKKSMELIEKDIKQWQQQIFYRIIDIKNNDNGKLENSKIDELIQETNFYLGRLYGIQDTLSNLNIEYNFNSIYETIKSHIQNNIYNNTIGNIIYNKYQFTALGQLY